MYSMNDYRAAISERDGYDMGTPEWNLGQMKVIGIVTAMISSGSTYYAQYMVKEVVDEVYNLNDCGASLEDEGVQFDLWLLESNGYTEKAKELRELDW